MAWRLLLSTHAQSNTTQASRQEEEGGTPNHSRREEGSRLAGVCFFAF
ncbi:uncharacterized protein PgNI_03169 [Pyricularia grisea]|uniref:Uncharacterized protein n=1 Tax=Pyricularia grisea TaxID=148305 RepID=A0A6P8BD85_PYRGI|nr:uncharacterized protein PgNI_03169 [Pyricularia grisea]TLD13778.1 hypothetical protein PgNI_03169 [Pyricularia grisea]